MKALTRAELATCLGVDLKPEFVIDWNAIRPVRNTPAVPRRIPVMEIATVCAQAGDIELNDLLGPRRAKHIAKYRHVALYLAAKHCNGHLSLPVIGRLLGRRDHSTVCHSRDKVKDDLRSGGEVFGDIVVRMERRLGITPVDNGDSGESGDNGH